MYFITAFDGKMEAHIDGSLFEGGGQILRNSLALALILGKRVTVYNIRAGRPKPGLAHSHLAAVLGLGTIGGCQITGAAVGSQTLTVVPGTIVPGEYDVICETAGSVALMFQELLPCVLSAECTVNFTVRTSQGGTDVSFSPSSYFIQRVLTPTLALMGVEFQYTVATHGFMPTGGGRVVLNAAPTS